MFQIFTWNVNLRVGFRSRRVTRVNFLLLWLSVFFETHVFKMTQNQSVDFFGAYTSWKYHMNIENDGLGKKTAISVQISLYPWKLTAGTWKYSIGKTRNIYSIYKLTILGGSWFKMLVFRGVVPVALHQPKNVFFHSPGPSQPAGWMAPPS